jgi:uncharacterized membrane protein YphA (DoxX/SURF4 family)
MKPLLTLVRFLVGVLFIFSGLVKANDPLGLSYKMQEFFEVWGLHAFNDYTLAFSVGMIAFEIIAGVAVIVGWQMKLFSWLLLLLIIFFTFLTGYAVLSGKIKECGCFGNCIPLTAWQSFMKDLVLLALILLIFKYRNQIKPMTRSAVSVSALLLSAVFSFGFMWYTLNHLPVVDCLPYKEGINILGGMKIPEGARPDSTVITFVYTHSGKEIEFTADKFPADFNDTTYTFVRRYDKLVRAGDATPAIKDFALTNQRGEPVTETFLNAEGLKLFLFVQHGYPQGEWLVKADVIARDAAKKGIARVLVTSVSLEQLYKNAPGAFYRFEPVMCDATAIKTAARANPTMILLNKDTILKKWSYQDFDKALEFVTSYNRLY